jgi:transposase
MRIMPAPRKYPQELRERAMRLVSEARQENPELWLHQAVARISSRVGVNPDTLRGWCKQAAIDAGERPGTTTGDFQKIKQLESEVRELKRANEILLAASSYFAGVRPATAVVIRFGVDDHKDRFGVEPIFRVLSAHGVQIGPSSYNAAKSRPVSAGACRDEQLLVAQIADQGLRCARLQAPRPRRKPNAVEAYSPSANRTNRNRDQARTAQNTCSPSCTPQSMINVLPGVHNPRAAIALAATPVPLRLTHQPSKVPRRPGIRAARALAATASPRSAPASSRPRSATMSATQSKFRGRTRPTSWCKPPGC